MLSKNTIITRFGEFTLVASQNGMRALLFENDVLNSKYISAQWSKKSPLIQKCEYEIHEYFDRKRTAFSVPIDIEGTDFQKSVWKYLVTIPFGRTVSYSQQAAAMGQKKSVRAIAAANARNPLAIIIPCHRVIASTGHLHGYAGGLKLKHKLLAHEGIKIRNNLVIGSEVEA